MKTKKVSTLQNKAVNTAIGIDGNNLVKTIIPNTIKPVGNWAKVIDTEGDLHAVFLLCIGRAITGSNATYIINIAKWSSTNFCEIAASMINKSGNATMSHRIYYKITDKRLEVWIYTDSLRVVSCLSANYAPMSIAEAPPADAITL